MKPTNAISRHEDIILVEHIEVIIMSNWAGYLFKAKKTNKVFPMKYIQADTWNSSPNQREEIKAYRDDNTRNLTRVTASGMKSKFSFKTRDGLTLEQKMEIQKFFTDAENEESDASEARKQRKVELTYWNDDVNDYKTGTFYIPNMDFPIKKCTSETIIYGELDLSFVEY